MVVWEFLVFGSNVVRGDCVVVNLGFWLCVGFQFRRFEICRLYFLMYEMLVWHS